MIFNPNQVIWKVRKGVNLPYAPHDSNDAPALENVSADAASQSQPEISNSNNVKLQSEPAVLSQNINSQSSGEQSVAQTVLEHQSDKATVPAQQTDRTVESHSETVPQNVNPSVEVTPPGSFAQNSFEISGNPTAITEIAKVATPVTADMGQGSIVNKTVNSQSIPSVPAADPVTATPGAPVVDGKTVDRTVLEAVKEQFPRWKSLPYKLRAKRADLFINLNSQVPFLQSLTDFLKSKGFDIKAYDDSVNYLPSDILLLDKTDLVRQGTVYVLQSGKKAIWNDLCYEFGDRLK